jgi:putative endopeptidase
MVKQAEEHEVLGIKLKGKLTAGENLADLGGLRLSLRALKKKMGDEPLTGKNAKLVDGFNPLQRFFLSWATVWRQVRSLLSPSFTTSKRTISNTPLISFLRFVSKQNIKDERAKQLVTIDPHGPNDFRANGPLRNMEEFYEAFDVKETDPMFKPKEERVDVW